MKKTLLFFLLFTIPYLSWADLGAGFHLKVNITTKSNETIEGYCTYWGHGLWTLAESTYYFKNASMEKPIAVNSTRKGIDGVIVTEYKELLSEIALAFFYETVTIYPDIIQIPGQHKDGFKMIFTHIVGESRVIKNEEIQSFEVKSIIEAPVYESIFTPLEYKDRLWAKKVIRHEDMGGGEYCNYRALIFVEPVPIIQEQLVELRAIFMELGAMDSSPEPYSSEYINELNQKIKEKVEILKSDGILITQACAC